MTMLNSRIQRAVATAIILGQSMVAAAAPGFPSSVDEPSGFGLLVTGVVALYLLRRRQNIA